MVCLGLQGPQWTCSGCVYSSLCLLVVLVVVANVAVRGHGLPPQLGGGFAPSVLLRTAPGGWSARGGQVIGVVSV